MLGIVVREETGTAVGTGTGIEKVIATMDVETEK